MFTNNGYCQLLMFCCHCLHCVSPFHKNLRSQFLVPSPFLPVTASSASTYDVEGDGVGLGRLGGDLALVDAGVPLLDELDEQHPLVLRVVAGGEPRVRGEALLARRQNVHVPVPHPRHLHSTGHILTMITKRKYSKEREVNATTKG